MRRRTRTPWVAAILLMLAGAASPVGAQERDTVAELEDGRWLPFLGCWVDTEAAAGPLTCVVPDGPGVALLTVAAGEVVDRRVLHAGAGARPADLAGCTGTERATFSRDGDRVFTDTRLTCGGADRSTAGLIAMVEPDRWIEVRALTGDAEGTAWVRRYRPAPVTRIELEAVADRVAAGTSPAVVSARAAASGSISVDDLVEAHAGTHAAAVRAWLVEDGERLRIDADALTRLADAGVDPAIIDVAVAVSFPDRFAVERGPDADRDGRALDRYGVLDRYRYDRPGWWGAWSPFGPYFYDPFYYRYDRYYGYGGLYGPSWVRYRPTRIVIVPTTPDHQGGRAVKGRGYTRGGGDGTATRPSVRPTGPAASRATATGKGHRGGSSSGSKGKAKPRGGG